MRKARAPRNRNRIPGAGPKHHETRDTSLSPALYACLYIADFAAAALTRGRSNSRAAPAAVYSGTPPNCFIHAANQAARKNGVKPGMPLAEAKARFAAPLPAGQDHPPCPF